MIEPSTVAELERTARALVDRGEATRDLQLALGQLVADRSNGEPLDVAAERLRVALAEHDGGDG